MPSEPPATGPRRVGKYEILKHIATGGMGAVYRARNSETGLEVALKVLAKDLASKPAVVERFKREAVHATKLTHENIVFLHDWGEVDNIYYLALEFVHGIDLSEYLRRKGKLGVEESRQIIMQAARALGHLHDRGIVHRDIKPANFMMIQKDGRPFIKLIDLGLAREIDSDQYRITRASFTLGTIDYMSPEQARDSGMADVRSDIYSLGCTWFQMLAGQPPFPEGSLTERLYKHIETPAPDVREFNRKVPAGLAQVLARMLAKKPADRYQTPAELLDALENPPKPGAGKGSDGLADLAEGEAVDLDPKPEPRDRSERTARRSSASRVSRIRKKKPAKGNQQALWIGLGGGGLLLLVAGIVAVGLLRHSPKKTPTQVVSTGPGELIVTPPPPVEIPPVNTRPGPLPTKSSEATRPDTSPLPRPPSPDVLPPLYKVLFTPIKPAEVWEQVERAWAKNSTPVPAKVLRVSRGSAGGEGSHYDSLAAALAALGEKESAVIEIQDNGPIFELPAAVSGRDLVLRGAKGYRPLLAWDWQNPAAKGSAFLALADGNLTLENLDVVLKCSESGPPEPAALFQVTEGSFLARDCTFSVAGKHRSGVTAVRVESSNQINPPRFKCRLDRCLLRGSEITALDLRVPAVDALLNGCLAVGGDRPLLRVAGYNLPVPRSTLAVVRSTLVAGQNLLQVRPATPNETRPELAWFGWDALLAHAGSLGQGEMVSLTEGVSPQSMRWQPVNCLYQGWQRLLASATGPVSDPAAWKAQWHIDEGDVARDIPWPGFALNDIGQTAPGEFQTAGKPVGFAATSGTGALGCDLTTLPLTRDRWLPLTYDLALAPPLDLPAGGPPPSGEVFQAGAGMDLGDFIQKMQAGRNPNFPLVVHLAGSGEQPSGPVRVKGFHLVLAFDPPPDPGTPPLTLVPREQTLGGQKAFIEVEDGNLEIHNGSIRFADLRTAPLPAHMLRVHNGHLGLFNCRLQGPVSDPPFNYLGLVGFDGPSTPSREQAHGCVVKNSVLISNPACIHVMGADTQVRLDNSLLMAGGDAFHLSPGPAGKDRIDIQLYVNHATVAVNRAVIHLDEDAAAGVPTEPVVFQAKATAFLDPFKVAAPQGGMLRYEGEALNHGLVVWQGEGNFYDRRLHYGTLPAQAPVPKEALALLGWVRLWGIPRERQPLPELIMTRTVDLAKAADVESIPLETLAVPTRAKTTPAAGADLVLLGVGKKLKGPR